MESLTLEEIYTKIRMKRAEKEWDEEELIAEKKEEEEARRNHYNKFYNYGVYGNSGGSSDPGGIGKMIVEKTFIVR
jgi:hypothetical protein